LEVVFGDAVLVVVSPALDHRIEGIDEASLRCPAMVLDDIPQLVPLALQRLATGFDEGLVTGFTPVSASAMFAHRILPYVEAQEVKTVPPVVRFEGVGDEGLFGMELQADLCQPFRCHNFEMAEDVKVVVKHHVSKPSSQSGQSSQSRIISVHEECSRICSAKCRTTKGTLETLTASSSTVVPFTAPAARDSSLSSRGALVGLSILVK
jgi:hypothetical protein